MFHLYLAKKGITTYEFIKRRKAKAEQLEIEEKRKRKLK